MRSLTNFLLLLFLICFYGCNVSDIIENKRDITLIIPDLQELKYDSFFIITCKSKGKIMSYTETDYIDKDKAINLRLEIGRNIDELLISIFDSSDYYAPEYQYELILSSDKDTYTVKYFRNIIGEYFECLSKTTSIKYLSPSIWFNNYDNTKVWVDNENFVFISEVGFGFYLSNLNIKKNTVTHLAKIGSKNNKLYYFEDNIYIWDAYGSESALYIFNLVTKKLVKRELNEYYHTSTIFMPNIQCFVNIEEVINKSYFHLNIIELQNENIVEQIKISEYDFKYYYNGSRIVINNDTNKVIYEISKNNENYIIQEVITLDYGDHWDSYIYENFVVLKSWSNLHILKNNEYYQPEIVQIDEEIKEFEVSPSGRYSLVAIEYKWLLIDNATSDILTSIKRSGDSFVALNDDNIIIKPYGAGNAYNYEIRDLY